MRILNLPLPIFTAILVPQIEPPGTSDGPAWAAAFFAFAFSLGWFLDRYDKLPGTSGNRRAGGYVDEDRKQATAQAVLIAEIHRTVTREDSEKPGWPMVWHSSRESREMCTAIARLAILADAWMRDREEWKVKQSNMEHRITQLEDVVRRQEHALKYGTGGVQG